MELHDKSVKELQDLAEKLKLKVPKNASEDVLRDMVERKAIEQTIRRETQVRTELERQFKIESDIEEIKLKALGLALDLKIPEKPTLADVLRLKKQVGLKETEPKPSPETIAIEKSKKVYVLFHNMEEKGVDIPFNKGGKYNFHLYDNRVHCLPEWLLGNLRKTAVNPIFGRVKDKINDEEKSARIGSEPRFVFEALGDAPDDAKFGVVLDDATLSKLKIAS